jgi:hypothetical protein
MCRAIHNIGTLSNAYIYYGDNKGFSIKIYLTLALITALNKPILNIINRPRRQGVNTLRKGILEYA